MKFKKALFTTTITGALVFSAVSPVLGHDSLDGSSAHKGERGAMTMEEIQNLSDSYLETSGKVSSLTEAAAQQIKEVNGVQNNTADVYAHKGYAYLGTHTANGGNGGVRVFDLQDPSNPEEVAVFANEDVPGSWQEKVIVKSVNTPDFKGDLAVVSVQQRNRNREDTSGGFLLYDVTNPENPEKLGYWEVYDRTSGTHELFLSTKNGKAYVYTANPYADYYSHGEQRDFQIVDVTNPRNPETIWQFDPRMLEEVDEDFDGYNWNAPDGKTRPVFNHSVITDDKGDYAYVSMWDLGTVIFDVKDPANPVYLGRTDFASDQQGSAHSATLAKGGNILIETREVYNPVKPGYEESYGYTRIFDIKDKTNPKLLSEFKTDLTEQVEDGVTFANTVHDPKVHGNTLYLSHYAGGIYMVDISDPASPEQIGQYRSDQADVWGVFVDRNYVLASDMGQGLKVLTRGNGKAPSKSN